MNKKTGAPTRALTAEQVKTELREINHELAAINAKKAELEERRKTLIAISHNALLGFQEILAEIQDVPAAEIGRSIETLPFNTRVANALHEKNVQTVEQLLKMTKRDIKSIPRLGRKSFMEMLYVLKEAGFSVNHLEQPD